MNLSSLERLGGHKFPGRPFGYLEEHLEIWTEIAGVGTYSKLRQ
jgi:hypothetical protein